jgi:hypothetical protein
MQIKSGHYISCVLVLLADFRTEICSLLLKLNKIKEIKGKNKDSSKIKVSCRLEFFIKFHDFFLPIDL